MFSFPDWLRKNIISSINTVRYRQMGQKLIIDLGACGGFSGDVNREEIILVTKTVIYDIYERSGHHDEQIETNTTSLNLS